MDIRDLNWKLRPAGDTLMQEIEALAKAVNVPVSKRRDLRWLSQNLRSHHSKQHAAEHAVLLNYVQTALQQGIIS